MDDKPARIDQNTTVNIIVLFAVGGLIISGVFWAGKVDEKGSSIEYRLTRIERILEQRAAKGPRIDAPASFAERVLWPPTQTEWRRTGQRE